MKNHKPQILVVEDEETLLKAWKEKFQRQGYEVLGATDGKSALESALKHHPDMVVTDLVMPSSDGLTLVKKLREDKWGQNVPVMFLSGWMGAESGDDEGGVEKLDNFSGSRDYYLSRNWSVQQVLMEVRKKLGIKQFVS